MAETGVRTAEVWQKAETIARVSPVLRKVSKRFSGNPVFRARFRPFRGVLSGVFETPVRPPLAQNLILKLNLLYRKKDKR